MAASGLAAQATAVMTQAGLDALARAVVRHMLFRNAELPGVPVPRADVTKLVAGAHRRAGAYVVALAQHMMVQCFGLEMKELDKPPARGARGAAAAAAAAAAGQGTKQFVLRSLVPEKLHAGVVREPCGDAARGFLGVVLALAEVSGGGVGVDALWRHLGDMGVAAEREHPRLGKPAALLEQLVKKRWVPPRPPACLPAWHALRSPFSCCCYFFDPWGCVPLDLMHASRCCLPGSLQVPAPGARGVQRRRGGDVLAGGERGRRVRRRRGQGLARRRVRGGSGGRGGGGR
jgi:hypothetical protein